MKIKNDKYYTPKQIASKCILKTQEIIGLDNIIEVIEPSAGNGSFSLQIPKCIAYDIEPEDASIIQQDYLKLKEGYKKGRLIIGNPPFGDKLKLGIAFYKKSVEIADYIAFILPIGQLNNTNVLYEFDLLYSEDLGMQDYSGVSLHCCFNIYKRNEKGLNKKKVTRLKDVKIIRQDNKKYNEILDYTLRLCYWGDGTAGKILKDTEKYSAEYKIVVNKEELKAKVVEVLTTVNWHQELNKVAMLKIQQYHIIDLLKREIPTIE